MSGREEEFRDFARSRAAPLHRSAYLLCGDWHIAHDLVQETLVKAYRHWPRVQQADSPDAYVRRILLNEARDRWRRQERTVSVAHFTAEPVVPDVTDDIARRMRLLQALLELPLQQRATVVLRYLEGMTQSETAELLGCSGLTTSTRRARSRARFRRGPSGELRLADDDQADTCPGRQPDRGPPLCRRAPHGRAVGGDGCRREVRDLRRYPDLPGGPHDQIFPGQAGCPAHQVRLHLGPEVRGHGEAHQQPADPGRFPAGPRRLAAGRHGETPGAAPGVLPEPRPPSLNEAVGRR